MSSNNTTMDGLAVGAVFQFGWDRTGEGIEYEKVSNLYARRLIYPRDEDCSVHPNATNPEEAAAIKVTYIRRSS